MPANSADEAFARNLLLTRMVTPEQVDAARDEQYVLAQKGRVMSLADVLIYQGMIT